MKHALLAWLSLALTLLVSGQAADSIDMPILENIVMTVNRDLAKRIESPIAINVLSQKTLSESKPVSLDQILNKVSGVNMVNLGNEQHQMSIRQPMTTKSLFLYLEDGIPVRTTGLFNHNALLEMNLAATRSIEVIKGPSSSLYGGEAIGGVINLLPLAIPSDIMFKASFQGSDIGYRRVDLQSGFTAGRWGVTVAGYHARKRDGYLEYSDFDKTILTARVGYKIAEGFSWNNLFTWFDYDSDMSGGIDSAMFASKTFRNLQTFTYRKVRGVRWRTGLDKKWNNYSKTSLNALFRDNSIGQNPAYRVKDDYRRVNGLFTGKKDLAHGEINESSFQTWMLIAQHRQQLKWKNAVLIAGASIENSPSRYDALYIRIKKDSVTNRYLSYDETDSTLTDYKTDVLNYAAFANFEFNLVPKIHAVLSVRYDGFTYRFDNSLTPSSFSGSPDTTSRFYRVTPKVGLTYNPSKAFGFYANYSEGFVPPQVTELYTGVRVPDLDASTFFNYEAGGWFSLASGKLYGDYSFYLLRGTNEIVNIRLDDGSFANANAGKTSHKGIETGVTYRPVKQFTVRASASYSQHRFIQYVEKGFDFNGNTMNNAPNWLFNTEAWYYPAWLKGFRFGAELQQVGAYWVDAQNTAKYPGYHVVHLRTGYKRRDFEVWFNVLNVADRYYSYITSKSAFGYSYQLAEPRSFNAGISYDFAAIFKTKTK